MLKKQERFGKQKETADAVSRLGHFLIDMATNAAPGAIAAAIAASTILAWLAWL